MLRIGSGLGLEILKIGSLLSKLEFLGLVKSLQINLEGLNSFLVKI